VRSSVFSYRFIPGCFRNLFVFHFSLNIPLVYFIVKLFLFPPVPVFGLKITVFVRAFGTEKEAHVPNRWARGQGVEPGRMGFVDVGDGVGMNCINVKQGKVARYCFRLPPSMSAIALNIG
jgi:hypothetical protein